MWLYRESRFYGLDVSEAMLRSARASLARFNLAARIVLRKGDASLPSMALTAFSFPNALSMIPAWREVVRQAAAGVAQGRTFHRRLR